MTELTVQTQNRLAEFRARLNTAPQGEIWQPMAGDVLVGVIVGGDTMEHPLYGLQRLLCVQTESGEVVKVYLNRWLTDNLRSKNADKGDLLALTFGGKKRTTTGKEYNSYSLTVEKV